MRYLKIISALIVLSLFLPPPCTVRAQQGEPGVSLTIYNQNFALVKDRRILEDELKVGLNVVRFRGVAATIDATSVHFRSLTDSQAVVSEQNYEFDLIGGNRLLEKYIDRQIAVHTADGNVYEGILLSFEDARLVLAHDRQAGPIVLVERGQNIRHIQFSELPGGLLTRPTLVWELIAEKPGRHLVELSYIAQQMRWRADYNMALNEEETAIDLSGWVTIENQCGTRFADAAVKLLAGQTHVDPRQIQWGYGHQYYKQLSELAPSRERGDDPSEIFGEYRMYRLPERTTVANREIKQVELITATSIPVTKTYLYDGAKIQWRRFGSFFQPAFGREENKKVNVLIEFENRADRNLGIALPQGKARVYKADEDGSMEFIGEDSLSHTPRDEKVTLYIGDAFDIVGERKQTDFRQINNRVYEEAFEIKIRNHKEEAVTVKVLEKLYRARDWEIRQQSQDHQELDSRTIVFPLRIEPDEEAVVTYRVRYQS